MMKPINKRSVGRRSYLKSLSTVAGLGALPVVNADSPTFADYRKALQRRKEENWELDRWYDLLEELGIRYGNNQETGDSGPSTQDISLFEKNDLTLTMTYEDFPDGDYEPAVDAVELKWEFSTGVDDTYTGEPKDAVKIGFQKDHFEKPSSLDGDDMYEFGSDMVGLAGNNGLTSRGLAAEYKGLFIDLQNPLIGDGRTGGDVDRQDWMKIFVDPSSDADQRTLYFGYTMTYDNAEINGVGIGTDGVIGFDIKNESDSWTAITAYEDKDLKNGTEYSP